VYKAALAALFVAALNLASVLVPTELPPRSRTFPAPLGSPPPSFRLGTAARPFGWSTAIGDLNADGRPDYAIADRIGRHAAGFEYALELSISGVGSRLVSFDSPHEALAVTLRDVNHDHALDVVVTALLSRAVVRVLLNDGAGRFREAPTPASVSEWQSADALSGGARPAGAPAVDSTPRRILHVLGSTSTARPSLAAVAPAAGHGGAVSRAFGATRLRSRAPPAAAVSTLA
jgi:hypothetical protein